MVYHGAYRNKRFDAAAEANTAKRQGQQTNGGTIGPRRWQNFFGRLHRALVSILLSRLKDFDNSSDLVSGGTPSLAGNSSNSYRIGLCRILSAGLNDLKS